MKLNIYTANGIRFTIARPLSMREREDLAKNIQPDPTAKKFNESHKHAGFEEDEPKKGG